MKRAAAVKLASAVGLTAVLGAALYFAGGAQDSPPGGEPAADARSEFPRRVRDYQGAELTIPSPPQRIASQALVTDEFLFALVAPSRIVAVSKVAHDERYSHVAAIVKELPVEIISDPEPLLRRNPDLVMVAHTARADYVELLRAARIPAFRILTLFETFDQVADGLRTTGYVTGEDEAALQQIEILRQRIAAAKKRRPADSGVMRVLAFSNSAYTYGKGSLFDHIVKELGAMNIGAEQGLTAYATIGSEQVAAWNPDWIVSGADKENLAAARAQLLENPGVAVTAAGRQQHILMVENLDYLSMSQHAVTLMESLADAMYPETK